MAPSPISPSGKLTDELAGLFRLLFEAEITTLDDAVALSQPWVSSIHKSHDGHKLERWEVPNIVPTIKRTQLWAAARELGFIDEWLPGRTHYKHVIVLGGTALPQRRRLKHLVACWENGVRFDTLSFLGSDRPLHTVQDSYERLTHPYEGCLKIRPDWDYQAGYTNETEILQAIWNQSCLPDGFPTTPRFVHAIGSAGQRATTECQLKTWLHTHPEPSPVLLVSSQPHNAFQALVARRILPAGCIIDVAGYSATIGPDDSMYLLGGIARWLYEYRQAVATRLAA